jgi:SH3-like domain-containing protein
MKQLNRRGIVHMMIVIMVGVFVLAGSAVAQERFAVKSSIANMRSGPGTKYDVLWQVEQYHPVTIVEKKKDWYKIKDFENDVAWIHESLLAKMTSVITIKSKCNVRSKPDKNSRILFTVEKGVPFRVHDRNGNWIKIEHADGDIGWIYKTLVW